MTGAENATGPAPTVDVCVCTFRRESLTETLASLSAQGLGAGRSLRVIVADNDESDAAKEKIESEGRRLGLALVYRHCPARNISIARNGALDAATAEFVAFIDDDEVATPDWLEGLLTEAEASGGDVVLGPVRPVYGADAPAWMRTGDFHATVPVIRDGVIPTGYTSNALMRREAPAVAGQRFDPALGRTGGEDTEFFDRVVERGGRIAYAPEAVVTEVVTPERARLGWLMRRRFRSGQTHGALLARRAGSLPAQFAQATIAAAKVGVCSAGFAATVLKPDRRAFWALRAALHAGAVSRLFGVSEIVQYGLEPGAKPQRASAARR